MYEDLDYQIELLKTALDKSQLSDATKEHIIYLITVEITHQRQRVERDTTN